MTQSHEASAQSIHSQADDPAAFLAVRRQFPILERLTYLSVCEKGIISRPTRAAVELYLDRMETAAASRTEHEEYVASARVKFAQLINAHPDEVAFTRNVSDGINSIIHAIDWQAGDNVVLTADLEHPNNHYPWRHLERLGVALRYVPPHAGAIDAAAMVNAIDEKTRAVTAASVTFAPGSRTNLRTIGASARERGVLFVVDAVQSAGIMALDAEADMFDCLATSTSKGLLGLYGSGFLYCRRSVADSLQPAYLSRTGIDAAQGTHSEGGSEDYRLIPGAQRFEVGSFPLAGAYAVDASLDTILGLGSRVIENHVLKLSTAFTQGLLDREFVVSQLPDSAHLSHIVTVGHLGSGGHDFSTNDNINRLGEYLQAQQVGFSIRRGQLRFAFHMYNNMDDAQRVLELVDAYRA